MLSPHGPLNVFDSIVERMEQRPEEIRPFADWISDRHPHHVIEIGVRWGGTAALWHGLSTGTVVGVDWIGQDGLGQVLTLELAKRMSIRHPRYRFVLGDSHELETREAVIAALNDEPVDLLFLDGDHSLAGISRDWELYKPLVRPGGVVAFHDIVNTAFVRSFGQGVYAFWETLQGSAETVEFNAGGEWGGIGAVVV